MKFNSPYVSLGALILAGSFVISPLRADPPSVPAMKTNGDERNLPVFERKEVSEGGLKERSDKHLSKNTDIVLAKEGADLFVGRDGKHDIMRVDSKAKKIEMMDLATAGAVGDLLDQRSEGKFLQLRVYAEKGKEDNAAWMKACADCGLQEKPDGSLSGNVSEKNFKKLVDDMTWTDVALADKTEVQEPKIKMVLSDSGGSLIIALHDGLESGEFKTRYTDRKRIVDEVLPAYKNLEKMNEKIKAQPDGLFELEAGLTGYKFGNSWSLVDSEKNRFVFNSFARAGKFQKWMRENGVGSGKRAIAVNVSDPLFSVLRQKGERVYDFGKVGIAYGNEDRGFDKYDGIPENSTRMIFIGYLEGDFERARDAYPQFLQLDSEGETPINPSIK